MIGAWFATEKFLADNNRQISFDATMRSASLFEANAPHASINATPLNMGFLGPNVKYGPDYRLEHVEEFEFAGGGPETVNGLQLVSVSFRSRQSGSQARFVLDPARGFLPVLGFKSCRRPGAAPDSPKVHMRLLKARECPDGRWFPEHVVSATVPDNSGGRFDVQEIKVIELQLDPKLTEEDFSIDIPAGTMVLAPNVAATEGVFFRTKQDEHVGLRDLDGMFGLLRACWERGRPGPGRHRIQWFLRRYPAWRNPFPTGSQREEG
jgi:hypothetical protein